MVTIKEISKKIKVSRKEKKLNQSELADICGVGRRFISELESGKKERYDLTLTLRVLQRLGLHLIFESESK
jgi:HTH-type transcriptional regulator / antitoxin HipB